MGLDSFLPCIPFCGRKTEGAGGSGGGAAAAGPADPGSMKLAWLLRARAMAEAQVCFIYLTVLNCNYLWLNLTNYGYATEYKKSAHAKCFLNSWYFRGTGPGTGCYFAYPTLFYAIRRYSRARMSRRFLTQGISYIR